MYQQPFGISISVKGFYHSMLQIYVFILFYDKEAKCDHTHKTKSNGPITAYYKNLFL